MNQPIKYIFCFLIVECIFPNLLKTYKLINSKLFWKYLKGEKRAHACWSKLTVADRKFDLLFWTRVIHLFRSQTIFARLVFALVHHQTALPQSDRARSRGVRRREYSKKTLGNYAFLSSFSGGNFGHEQLGWNNVESFATSAGKN